MSANKATLNPSHHVLKVNNYGSKYSIQHGALAHTEHQSINCPKLTSVKPTKTGIQRVCGIS